MSQANRKFYDITANQRADQLPWDLASDAAKSCEAPSLDLRSQADRERAFFMHLIESVGGLAPFCEAYGTNRDVMSRYVYEGKAFDDVDGLSDYARQQVENTRRRLEHYVDEFASLASNSPVWAQMNVLGAQQK